MTKIALLTSQDASLINAVRAIVDPIRDLRLEICANRSEVWSLVHREELALLVIHLASGEDDEEVTRLVGIVASSGRSIATLILSDEYQSHQAVSLLRSGATDYVGIAQGLDMLPYFWEAVSGSTDQPRAGHAGNGCAAAARAPSFYVYSPEMLAMIDQVRRVARQDTTLLLTGETGTGKTRLARLIHQLSPRAAEPFLVVDCAALSANLLESEIFGHAKGAFTGADWEREGKFAAAGRGTLLIDDINALPMALQGKLLRAVDEHVYEPVGSNQTRVLQARIIAAANVPLDRAVHMGQFRQDLYFRLNVVAFHLPPLRERRDGITPLADRFLAEFSARERRDVRGFAPEALRLLGRYNWPGNIRELRNSIRRAVLLTAGPEIHDNDLFERSARNGGLSATFPGTIGDAAKPLAQTRVEVELQRITAALRKHRNNRLRAAAELGISRMALYNKLHKYGLF